MAEYVQYDRKVVGIGTAENLYYVSYEKFSNAFAEGRLMKVENNLQPQNYLATRHGFRFRFPFPDEDKLPFGEIIEPYDRGVPITVYNEVLPCKQDGSETYEMEIVGQKPVIMGSDGKECLALEWRESGTNNYFSMDDEDDVGKLLAQIVLNHIISEQDTEKKQFYREIASRIAKGYGIDLQMEHIQTVEIKKPGVRSQVKKQKHRRNGF